MRGRAAAVAAVLATLAIAGTARGQAPASPCALLDAPTLTFRASDPQRGLIDLGAFADGRPVTFYECAGGQAHPIATSTTIENGATVLNGATFWRCDRLVRHFAATVAGSDGVELVGQSEVRTPSCAGRFHVVAPRTAARGRALGMRVVDGWGIGGAHPSLCVTPPGRRARCGTVRFAPATHVVVRTLALSRRGIWRVSVGAGAPRTATQIAVGTRAVRVAPLPVVLATGDSTMQNVDAYLGDELAGTAVVASDVRPGWGMSDRDAWRVLAPLQVHEHHQAVTVVSLGLAEGFPMRGADGVVHACCDAAWTTEYAARVRRAMRAYARGGRGRVVYLTVALPRDPARATIVQAVNAAIVRAANGLSAVRVLRMDELFTPDGYRETMRYGGREVVVRDPDGMHLNVTGSAIEARGAAVAVRAALRDLSRRASRR